MRNQLDVRASRIWSAILLVLTSHCLAETAWAADVISAWSPNGRNEIRVHVRAGRVNYEVRRDDQVLFAPSRFHPVTADDAAVLSLGETSRDTISEQSPLPWGKSNTLIDHCEQVGVICQNTNGTEWQLTLRAYDDGVAFRYRLSPLTSGKPIEVTSEETEFNAAGNPRALFNTLEGFCTSHESLYEFRPLTEVPAGKLFDCPLLLVWPDGRAAAITEARVRHFAGMYLQRPAVETTTLRSRLSPLPDRPNAAVVSNKELVSPWRVIMLADAAGELLESNLLTCLNDPPQGDFSWVRPGKTTFHWWNGEFEEDYQRPDRTEVFVSRHKRYIDFCARHGIAYHGISGDGRPWYPQQSTDYAAPSPDADVRKSLPELEFPTIFAYARERGVGIRLWVHWLPLSKHLEEAFAEYERWGVQGLMVDFLDRDDQEMIEFSERVLECAARHKLNIQFHGSSKNSGEQRTFPNLVNREGVLNLEYLKWSDRCTPDHNVNVAYTRALTGLVDYHHGGFRSVSRAKFQPIPLAPTVLGTRCHHLALYLVYENPLPMLADKPDNYEGEAGFDFLCAMPSTWDETRFLSGQPGEFVALARRRGDTWYLGGITNWTPRHVEVPLDMLGAGDFGMKLLRDGSLDEEQPNEVDISERKVHGTDSLTIQLAPGGGFVAAVTPLPAQ